MDDQRRGMKSKTIRKVLRKLIDNWLESIEDKSVMELVKANTIITGGSIASMLLGEPINDFDVYFRNRETTLAVANYYIARFKPGVTRGIPCKMYVDSTMSGSAK